jgi:hypothetical protein
MSTNRLVRLEDLLGRKVLTQDDAVAGRIEEVRAEKRGTSYEVTGYLLGSGALLERLDLTSRLFGRRKKRVVRWDQLSIARGPTLRLTCPIEELEME